MESRLVSSSTVSDDINRCHDNNHAKNQTTSTANLSGKKSKKRNRPTLAMKLQIISDVEAGATKSHVAQRYKINRTTVSKIVSAKDNIRKLLESSDYSAQRCRITQSHYPELEEMLWEWYKDAAGQSKNQVPNVLIYKKAKEIANHLGMSNFKLGQSWVHRFRQRRGVVNNSIDRLSKIKGTPPVNPDLLDQWKLVTLPSLFKNFSPSNIFTLHETALFYNCTLDRISLLAGESCTGGKHARDRLSVVFVCNMTGQEKQRLIVVGKFGRPKSLKNVRTLPTEYVSNKRAWMIPSYFEKWLLRFDQTMKTAGRKVALLVTSSENHENDKVLNAVTLIHLPPSADLQPAYQGIVQKLKLNYRQAVLQKHFDKIKEFGPYDKLNISVLDALLWLRGAWNSVSTQCIKGAFRKAGLYQQGHLDNDPGNTLERTSKIENNYFSLFKSLKKEMHLDSLVTAEGYLSVDSYAVTYGKMTFCQLMMANAASKGSGLEEEVDDLGTGSEFVPSIEDTSQSIKTLRSFFEHHSSSLETLKNLDEIERYVHRLSNPLSKQTTILDYFVKRSIKTSRVPKQSDSYLFQRYY